MATLLSKLDSAPRQSSSLSSSLLRDFFYVQPPPRQEPQPQPQHLQRLPHPTLTSVLVLVTVVTMALAFVLAVVGLMMA